MDKNVYLYVCPNLADCEAALAIAMISDLNTDIPPKKRSYHIITFGLTKEPVTTTGGITILPDADVDSVKLSDAAMVILPGSSQYEHDDPTRLVPLIRDCIHHTIPVAAICGATLFLANHGFLDTVRHTSCGAGGWLKQRAPDYHASTGMCLRRVYVTGGHHHGKPAGFCRFCLPYHTDAGGVPAGVSGDLVCGGEKRVSGCGSVLEGGRGWSERDEAGFYIG
ncbi:DJ-1/PfpI family protein [Methanogenium cariaci]|uniref:DJ-1/PfpI family protein n=1 Tax=Methanogenium cariaci TaxID=2197 RepID=UPI001FDF6CEF|nr:DJ-1/PfpI family protein [Methanogenium cariaci]